jgi:hypothetical protein
MIVETDEMLGIDEDCSTGRRQAWRQSWFRVRDLQSIFVLTEVRCSHLVRNYEDSALCHLGMLVVWEKVEPGPLSIP